MFMPPIVGGGGRAVKAVRFPLWNEQGLKSDCHLPDGIVKHQGVWISGDGCSKNCKAACFGTANE